MINIKQIRKELGLTQRQLANELGLASINYERKTNKHKVSDHFADVGKTIQMPKK